MFLIIAKRLLAKDTRTVSKLERTMERRRRATSLSVRTTITTLASVITLKFTGRDSREVMETGIG
jgi:hypothetical protein